MNQRARRTGSRVLICIALALALALAACEGTSGDGEAGSGTAGAMNGMAGATGGSGNGGSSGNGGAGAGGSSGQGGAGNGGSGGSSGSGSGGAGGSGGSSGQGGMAAVDASTEADAEQDSGPLPASCSGGGYLICEDFEDTALGEVPQGWSKFGDPVGVADDQAASGTKSLKMSESEEWRAMERDASSLPATHWGRIRYRVDADVPDAFVHSTMVSLSGKSPADDADLVMRVVDTVKQSSGNGSAHQFLYNVQRIGQNELGKEGPYDWTFDGMWHCVEWYVSHDDQAFRFFFDGDEVEQMAFENGAGIYSNSEIPSAFDTLQVGWLSYQGSPPGFTAWIDDVAIADQRVACD